MEFPKDYVEKYDKSNLLEDIKSIPQQLQEGYSLPEDVEINKEYASVVILGMGGSSISGFLIQRYLGDSSTPIYVKHDYHLPSSTDGESLVIAVSYSGNTEETISAYREALRKGCDVVVMATGGRMQEMAGVHKNQFVKLPAGMQPRSSIGYQFSALLNIFEKAGIVKNAKEEIEKSSKALKIDMFLEPSVNLSEKLVGKIPIIYSSELFFPVAYRWQTQMNENAKVLAISNSFSELNHNEILGYMNANKQGRFHAVIIKNQNDSPKIQKRMELTKSILQKRGIDVTELGIKGNSLLTRLFSALVLGDLTSFYLAMRYEMDPSPIEDISWLKEKLK